jgi:ATP-dependent helicase/nuclease subunit B
LRKFDARVDAHEGDQFNYRLTRAGKIHGSCREALPFGQFKALMDQVQTTLRNMGLQIFSGVADVSPYRKGSTTACDRCAYRAVCRIDPWTHRFRVLKP